MFGKSLILLFIVKILFPSFRIVPQKVVLRYGAEGFLYFGGENALFCEKNKVWFSSFGTIRDSLINFLPFSLFFFSTNITLVKISVYIVKQLFCDIFYVRVFASFKLHMFWRMYFELRISNAMETSLTLQRRKGSFWINFVLVLDFFYLIIKIQWPNFLNYANITHIYSIQILEQKPFFNFDAVNRDT